jgi:uncharacterized protein YfaS (alpha-2-macroglobulin family)
MNTARIPLLLHGLLLIACLAPLPALRAQDAVSAGKAALTFDHHPYSFDWSNPLTPGSPVLLRFNVPVEPDAVEGGLKLYDQPNDRFAAVSAKRPTLEEIRRFIESPAAEIALDHFVVIRPATPLPLGGTWFINATAGLASADGTHEIIESRLDYIGELEAFQVSEILAMNPYDSGREISIRHNKGNMAAEFQGDRLKDYLTVKPAPGDLKIDASSGSFILRGTFEFGTEYEVTLRDGLIANDTTRLDQVVTRKLTFEANPGFVTYPAFATAQNASGHRRFDVQTGNLTGLRTRVKRLAGKDLILALREYRDKYEGWSEKRNLAFEAVPGETIHDCFSEAKAGIDRSETVSLDWNEMTKGATTGAFYLCSEGASATREKLSVGAQSLIQLTDIGLAWKQGEDGTTVYAFSLKSGKPLAGLGVTLWDDSITSLAETETDKDGIARIARGLYRDPEKRFYLDAVLGEDRHVIQFHEDLNSVGLWSFGVEQRWDDVLPGERRTLIFTDRDVYRPGDEVKLKAIARFIDADKLTGPGEGAARFRVFDALHRQLFEREITFGKNGSFDTAFTLPSEGMGWYAVEIDYNPAPAPNTPEDQVVEPDWRLIATHAFQVEDYRVNTFEVTVAAAEEYAQRAEINIPVSARYFMGKPLSKADVSWIVYAENDFPRPRGFDEFQFGNVAADEKTFSSEGTAALGAKGEATVTFSLPEQTTHPGPRRVSLTASVTDANQQTLSGSKRFTVHSSDFYLGLREPDGVHRAGDKATFAVAAVTTGGKAHTDPFETSFLVEKEEWTTVKVMGANGKMTHRNDLMLRTVSDERITVKTEIDAATGLTRAMPHTLTFAEAGDYRITLTAKDKAGRDIVTKVKFNVIGAEEPSWSWHDVIRIDLTPDKESYRVGDTAKLLARTPVFGNALFSIERGGVRETRSLVIDQYETVLEVPIAEGAAPNLFASLLIIRGSGDSPHVHKAADYRLGYCQLVVDDPAVKLTTKVSAGDAKYYQPGEEIEFTATVLDSGSKPVAGAEVTFYAVDEGILSLTGYRTPDPGATFHAPFPLSVWTGQSLGDLLPENPLEQDFANKGYVIGGGGGGFGLDPDRIRKDFKALAFWEAALVTDANGVVRAKAVAPDNLTTFRVIAVVAEGNRFGSGETPVAINKPLIIEPALPGFTNVTDQIDIAAVLHNNSGAPQEVEIAVTLDEHAMFVGRIGETINTSLTPAAGAGEKLVKLSLPSGATETVSFPVAMTATGEAKWTWKVRSLTDGKLRDSVESKFAVGYPLPLLRETHTVALRDGSDLGDALAKIDRRLLEGDGSVKVTLSNSRLIEAVEGLDYLLKYPYGCVEQTTSSTIPWLSTQQLRKVLPELGKSEEEVAAIIGKGVTRLFSMQTGDGGLAYWPGGTESVLWGSAYAGVAVAMAAKQGVPVPKEQSQALWDYLSLQLRGAAEVNDPYELSQRCLAAYALALAGINENAYHEVLFEKQKVLTSEARSLLALAMVESGAAQVDRVQTLLKPATKVPVAEVSWYRQPYIAATRLLAQVRHNPASPESDQLVDELMKLREARNGWGSTYSNAWPLIALGAYGEVAAKNLGPNEVEIAFDGDTRTVKLPAEPGTGGATFAFKGKGDGRKLSLKTSGNGAVFANLSIATRPALMPLEPENKGFAIKRTYEKVEIDGSIQPAENLKVGDLILVTLDVNIPNERETYLAIDDALPAIFEAVNPDFKTSETQRVNARRQARSLYATHSEIRKDRVLFFADDVFGAGDYSLQYLARVVAPGEVTAPPAKIEAMYEPQRFGLSGTGRITAAARPLDKGEVAVAAAPK